MKKSNRILLTFLTGTAMLVGGCDDSNANAPIVSAADCVAKTGKTETECKNEFAQAQQDHLLNAPKFSAKSECEAKFGVGNCESRQDPQQASGSFFLPMMMGYWMGGGFNSNRNVQPVYNTPRGYATPQSYRAGTVATPPAAHTATVGRAASVSRGGFGGSARSSVGG